MQYTPHYNLNLPEGTDIVNPLVQDNPNYTAIDTALYNNKLRVIGSATHVKVDTDHAITLGDSDINQFKFVATGDYVAGDTFTVDGVTVTPRIADGSTIPDGAFKINSTVLCILDGTVLNLVNVTGSYNAANVTYDGTQSGLAATKVQGAIDEVSGNVDALSTKLSGLIKYKDVYGTTSATGSLGLGLTYPDNIVISVVATNTGNMCIPRVFSDQWGAIYATDTGTTVNTVPGATVHYKVHYIDLTSL